MKKIHEYLTKKYSQYGVWDKNPRHNIYHWVLFISFAFLVWAIASNSIRAQNIPVAAQNASDTQTLSFIETFSGSPRNLDGTYSNDPPRPFTQINQDKWDIAIHARDEREPPQHSNEVAHHGSMCEAPIPNTTLPVSPSNRLIKHPIDGSAESVVFLCRDHIMTSAEGGGYAVIYLTPNHMVDFSNGEAVIRWDMSTFRSSERDWIDIWITPFEDNLQLPLNPGFPDLQGPPRRAIQLLMSNNEGSLCPNFWLNGASLAGPTCKNQYTPVEDIPGFPDYSPARRDTFEIRISKTHLKVGMPAYNWWFYDDAIPSSLMNWDKGVVQFGHHSYSPEKGTHLQETDTGIATNNTWHWDNMSINPSVPFTMIKGDKRWVSGFDDGSDGTISTEQATVTFKSPAPANSFLRFSGFGDRDIEYITNVDSIWRPAQLNFQDNSTHITNYWTPVPTGTTWVRFRSPNLGWWSGGIKDLAIWSQTTGPAPTVNPNVTATPTSTVTPIPNISVALSPTSTPIPSPTMTPTPTIRINTPTPTPSTTTLKLGYTKVGAYVDSSNSNYMNSTRFTMGAQNGLVSKASVYVGAVDISPNNQFEIAIYTNNNGVPRTLVAKSTRGTLKANSWNTVNITASLKAKTAYWIAFNTNGRSTSVNNMRFDSTTNLGKTAWSTNGQVFGTWPTTFGPVTKQGAIFSIYLTYTPN